MENKTLTAVEWLFKELDENGNWFGFAEEIQSILNKAKAMEKEQISKAWNDGDYAYFYSKETGRDFENGEQYYNETFKNK
jgi:hypothetical protein